MVCLTKIFLNYQSITRYAKCLYEINKQKLEVVKDTLNVLFTNPFVFPHEVEPVPEEQIKKLLETVDKNLLYEIVV